MSKIFAELTKATGLTIDSKNQDDLKKLILAVGNDLTDKAWAGLASASQDWYNEAADAMNAEKTIPVFPDAEKDEPAAPARRRAAAAEPEAKKDEKPSVENLEEGQHVKVSTKRRDVTGTVVENNPKKELLVVADDDGGKEREFDYDEITALEVFHGTAGSEPEAGPAEPVVGDKVRLTNRRDKVFEGIITELTDDEIVIEIDGEPEDFDREKVKSIEVLEKGKAAAKDKPAAASRRGTAKEPAAADKPADKPKRSSNPEGVSVGARIRELMCADLGISQDEVGAALDKEKLEYRPPTLKIIYKDTKAVIDLLIENKHLKAPK